MKKYTLLFILFVTTASFYSQNKIPDGFVTLFESSGFLRTPRYDETIAYFRKLEKSSPFAKMIPFGKTPQGRDLWCLIVSKDKAFSPEAAKKSGKPVFFITNGIHSGEIEGKDASMLLLREILVTKEKSKLLDDVILLVVPVFSADAHERFGAFNRINQNGPVEMGWRTTAQNLNLNRDWLKADAPEMQSMLALLSKWLPDYFVDTHTTDGSDFQYSANYGIEKAQNMYARSAEMIKQSLIPWLEKRTAEKGFYIAPYVGFKEGGFHKGIYEWPGSPRFSTGYMAVQNRIALLVETHMLKPYKERVFATKAMLEASLEFVASHRKELIDLNREADEQSAKDFSMLHKPFPVQFKLSDNAAKYFYRGISSVNDSSVISGGMKTTFTGKKDDDSVPYFNSVLVSDSVYAPFAYIIPAEWTTILERLKLHGIKMQQTKTDQELRVTAYKFKDVKFAASPYEGHHSVTCSYDTFSHRAKIRAGSYIVYTNQRTVRVIISALEPKSGDSFLRWGFMNAIFEQKEYFEDYVMEKVALQMYENDPKLREDFNKKLESDTLFRKDPHQRLDYFYQKSPYWDAQYRIYPILRVEQFEKIL